MLFLQEIDKIYEDTRRKYDIPARNVDFSAFIPIRITIEGRDFSFLIRKGKKAKLLILSGKQQVYLSDVQIMNTILSMEPTDVEWFLGQFVDLYQGRGTEISLHFNRKKYTYTGIHAYPNEKKLMLFSDTSIDISCFCCLLNFIFSKDTCWEDISKTPGFGKKTLCKYISVIDFHYRGSTYSREFLANIHYPIEHSAPSEFIEKRHLFEKVDFIKTFDISAYQ